MRTARPLVLVCLSAILSQPAQAGLGLAESKNLSEILSLFGEQSPEGLVVRLVDLGDQPARVTYRVGGPLSISFIEMEIRQDADTGLVYQRRSQVTFTDEHADGRLGRAERIGLHDGAERRDEIVDGGAQALFIDIVEDVLDYLRNLKPQEHKSG